MSSIFLEAGCGRTEGENGLRGQRRQAGRQDRQQDEEQAACGWPEGRRRRRKKHMACNKLAGKNISGKA